MKKTIVASLIVLGLVAAGTGIWYSTKPKATAGSGAMSDVRPARGAAGAQRALPVHTVAVISAAVPVVLDAVGTVESEQSVAIRAEVSGLLKKVNFREGDLVKVGQLLFQIEASAPQAEVERVRANLARDQAVWEEALAQVKRLEPLAAKEYVTQQEYAQAVAQERAAHATVQADQAALKSAQVQLGYAGITAPISGRAGILNIKQGNLVSAASTTPLVVINGTQPVMVAFSVPQQQLQEIREGQRKRPLTVEVRRNVQDKVLTTGALAFIDNAVDTQTGTIRLKARITNHNEILWPGELVALRLISSLQQGALVVPETAVQAGQTGPFVYWVIDGKAQVQPITVARQVGDQVVIASGVTAGQPVIVNAPKNLRPDSVVEMADAKKSGLTNGRDAAKDKAGANGPDAGKNKGSANGKGRRPVDDPSRVSKPDAASANRP